MTHTAETRIATIEEWVEAQREHVESERRETERQERERAGVEKERKVEECNKLLSEWGVPVEVAYDDPAFPFITIGDHEFLFSSGGWTSTYGSYRAEFAHVLREPDGGSQFAEPRVRDAETLAMWLTGEYVQVRKHIDENGDEIRNTPAEPPIPDVYRSMECCSPHYLNKWLNQQLQEGYSLHTMSAYGSSEGCGVWVIVKRNGQ